MKKFIGFATLLLLVSCTLNGCSKKDESDVWSSVPSESKPETYWNGYFDEPVQKWGTKQSTIIRYYGTPTEKYTNGNTELIGYGTGHLKGVSSVVYAFEYDMLVYSQIVVLMQTSAFENAMEKNFNLQNESGFLNKTYSYVSKDGNTLVSAQKTSSGGSADSKFTIRYSRN